MSFPTLPSTTVYPAPRGGDATGALSAAPVAPFPEIVAPRAKRILSFDIENRPLSYWYDDRCTAEVTAIAWGSPGGPVRAACLGGEMGAGLPLRVDARFMLACFVAAYNDADIVTGHYIRKHDLPILNGALIEQGMAPLGPKLTSDTRLDLVRWKDWPASLDHLANHFGLGEKKLGMSQADWRQANRLTAEGIAKTRARVTSDVRLHLELRERLLAEGLLKAPRMWRP